MSTNGGAKQQRGFCERCGDANPYTVIVCGGCGARLPWATHGHRVTQHAPTARIGKTVQNTGQPRSGSAAPATPTAANTASSRVVTLAPGAASKPTPSTPAIPTSSNGSANPSADWPQSGPLASHAPATPNQPSPAAHSSVHMWVNPEPQQENLSPCVVCGNVHVQRVRNICGADQWPGTGKAISAGHGHRWHRSGVPPVDAVSTAPGAPKAQLALALALAPPPSPTVERHNTIYGALTLVMLGLVCLPITLTIRDALPLVAHGLNALFFGTALVLFVISLADARTARRAYQEQHAKWQRQMKNWSALLYCDRCDNVFHPAKGEATRVRNMNSLL